MNWTVNLMYLILLNSLIGTGMTSVWIFAGKTIEWAGYLKWKYHFMKLVLVFWLCPFFYFIGIARKEEFRAEWDWNLPMHSPVLLTISRIFLLFWVCGVVFFLKLYIQELLILGKIRKAALDCEDEVQDCFHETAGSFANISLGKSPLINVPQLIGVRHPCILLPDRSYTKEELQVIFKHELVHARHRDVLWKNLSFIIQAVYFFNPGSRWFSRELNRWCEYACDYEVCVSENDMKHYYSVILDMAEEGINGNIPAAGLVEDGSILKERMVCVKRSFGEKIKGLAVFEVAAMIWISIDSIIVDAHVLANLL